MTIEKFKELKVGDKVRIISEPPKGFDWWWVRGKMDKYCGKVLTIRHISTFMFNFVQVEELKGKEEDWAFYASHIAEKVTDEPQYPVIVEHLTRGNKTIVKLSNGKVGVAKCSPEDEFDVYEGLRLATERAYEKSGITPKAPEKKEECKSEPEPKVKEVKRVAEVGEWIKIVHCCLQHTGYKNGDILQVYKKADEVWFRGSVFCELKGKVRCEDPSKKVCNDNGNVVINAGEYVVLEGYKPEPEAKVKEVDRNAKTGEYIKIIKPECTFGDYRKGSILKVRRVKCDGGVDVYPYKREKGLPGYDSVCTYIRRREYVVLENYDPKKNKSKKSK